MSEYPVMDNVSKETIDLIGRGIIKALTPFEVRVKTLAEDKGKEF